MDAFEKAECVLLGFPLYTDAMPGIVKAFIDRLEPFIGRKHNPPIGFLVQSVSLNQPIQDMLNVISKNWPGAGFSLSGHDRQGRRRRAAHDAGEHEP